MPDITTFNRLAEILGVDLNHFSEDSQSTYDETPSGVPVDNTGDSEQTAQGRQMQINLTAVDLQGSDFAALFYTKENSKRARCAERILPAPT